MQEAAVTPSERLAEYRRDALFSLASFAGMEVLKRTSPQLFWSMKVVRSLLVLAIARKFIRNGVQGMVKEHRPNADTLTATAVIASVLAGKPESSLTLLAISNGAEMLTSYAAERARTQISGLLSLDQRYVWLVDGEVERKVPIELVKAGDIIAAHTGEKIVIDGRVLRGDAAINQASITGESNPAMKHKGMPVYAGSVVEAGELVIAVEKVGKDTSLAHIVHLVEEAQTRKAPVQNFADQMANFLVPISFLGAAIVYGATRDWQHTDGRRAADRFRQDGGRCDGEGNGVARRFGGTALGPPAGCRHPEVRQGARLEDASPQKLQDHRGARHAGGSPRF